MCICNHFRSTNTIMILNFFQCSLSLHTLWLYFSFMNEFKVKKKSYFEEIYLYIHKTIIHIYKHTPYNIYIFLYDFKKKKQNNKKSLFFFVCPIQRFSFKICTFFTSVRRTFISWNYHLCSEFAIYIYQCIDTSVYTVIVLLKDFIT